EGYGKISSSLINDGTIQPTGDGTIVVGGAMTNPASGIIAIGAGDKLLVSSGLASNAGLITLTGGTFDNGNLPLTNAAGGQITGYGVIRTGGTGLTNNGTMYLTGGTTTVNGNVTNNTTIDLNFQPSTFTGNVFNYGTIKATGMTATFSGSLTNEAGSHYTSDPSQNIFESAVTNAGTMTGGSGDQYLVSGGTFNNTGTYNNAGYLQSSDPTTNSGTFTQTGPQDWAAGTTFTNTAGIATFGSDTGSVTTAPLNFDVTGGSVSFQATQHIASLIMTPGSGYTDVTGSTVYVEYGSAADPVASIDSYLTSGYAGGKWTGTGIDSSIVANLDATQSKLIYAVGYGDGADGIVSGLSSGQIEILPTLAGDAKLAGNVVFGDFQILAQYFGKTAGWDEGNFTYQPTVDFGDFQQLAQDFGANSSAITASEFASLNSFAGEFGEALVPNPGGVGFSVAAIPEPASIGVIAFAGFGLLSRRRRNRR
ncbi:MAG TPA: PEP-CTERM sorting domain-containing protein, partial [Tepidisphaeraceae bacterium]|nr:PEP-CTERM sorting domain-containing protein [Tepidisphaeraceae bacterium]